MDSLAIVASISTAVASIVASVVTAFAATSASVQIRLRRAAVVLLAAIAASALVFIGLFATHVGPFETRSISITSGVGNTGCFTDLSGDAKVPAGEDAWILLESDDTGKFYIQGPPGLHAIVSGEANRHWTLPGVEISDKFYANAGYEVLGLIVTFVDSARLQAMPADQPLSAAAFPKNILASTRAHITLSSTRDCK